MHNVVEPDSVSWSFVRLLGEAAVNWSWKVCAGWEQERSHTHSEWHILEGHKR